MALGPDKALDRYQFMANTMATHDLVNIAKASGLTWGVGMGRAADMGQAHVNIPGRRPLHGHCLCRDQYLDVVVAAVVVVVVVVVVDVVVVVVADVVVAALLKAIP